LGVVGLGLGLSGVLVVFLGFGVSFGFGTYPSEV
jgi:hypothetical protein